MRGIVIGIPGKVARSLHLDVAPVLIMEHRIIGFKGLGFWVGP